MRADSKRHRTRSSQVALAKLVLVAPAFLLMSWWSGKVAAVDALARRSPVQAARVAPDHPKIAMTLSPSGAELAAGEIGEGVRTNVIAALASAPLAEQPFLVAGAALLGTSAEEKGAAMLEEARRRNPRSRPVRLLLANLYLKEGRVAEAAVELSALRRLVPDVSAILVPQFARMAREGSSSALAQAIRHDVGLYHSVLAYLATTAGDPALILAMARAGPPAEEGGEAPAWQRILLERLVKEGDLSGAFELWQSFTPGAAGAARTVYDARFQGLPGNPPFNWTLLADDAGIAEPIRGSGLDVEFFGRRDAVLASQLIMLRPGRYRFSTAVEGNVTGEGAQLDWRISCYDSSTTLVDVGLGEHRSGGGARAAEFTVPAGGCKGQWLRLVGTAGELPETQRATISAVEVVPVRSQ